MKKLITVILISGSFGMLPVFAHDPLCHDVEICNRINSDKIENEIKLKQTITQAKESPHDLAVKSNRTLYETQDVILCEILRRYCRTVITGVSQ